MKLLTLEKTHSGDFLHSYKAFYENNDKDIKEYELISRKDDLTVDKLSNEHDKSDAVSIIAFQAHDGRILLQKEFRLACNAWVYNFPGGLIDIGESVFTAAKRELKEETGLNIVKTIKVLDKAYSAVGMSNETVTTCICFADGNFKESSCVNEEIEASWYTKEEIKELLENHSLMSLRTQTFLYLWASDLFEYV